jgi:hypothetical protein
MFYRNNAAGVSRIVGNYQATRRHLKTGIDVAKAGKVNLTQKRSRGNSTVLPSKLTVYYDHAHSKTQFNANCYSQGYLPCPPEHLIDRQ